APLLALPRRALAASRAGPVRERDRARVRGARPGGRRAPRRCAARHGGGGRLRPRERRRERPRRASQPAAGGVRAPGTPPGGAGPFVERAPDLVLELALVDGYSRSCLPSAGPGPALRRLAPAEHGGGKGRGMNGAHRPDGLFVLAGAGVRPAGALGPAAIVDVLPTLLALA